MMQVAAQTELGKRCSEVMKNGGLVSMDDTLQLLRNAMLAAVSKTTKGFLVDGYPRELAQVHGFVAKVWAVLGAWHCRLFYEHLNSASLSIGLWYFPTPSQ